MYMYRKTVAIVIKSRSTSKVMDRAGNLSAELPQGIRERAALPGNEFFSPPHRLSRLSARPGRPSNLRTREYKKREIERKKKRK
jgi:hypothetical protein